MEDFWLYGSLIADRQVVWEAYMRLLREPGWVQAGSIRAEMLGFYMRIYHKLTRQLHNILLSSLSRSFEW